MNDIHLKREFRDYRQTKSIIHYKIRELFYIFVYIIKDEIKGLFAKFI